MLLHNEIQLATNNADSAAPLFTITTDVDDLLGPYQSNVITKNSKQVPVQWLSPPQYFNVHVPLRYLVWIWTKERPCLAGLETSTVSTNHM
jgi:hypothetical protein